MTHATLNGEDELSLDAHTTVRVDAVRSPERRAPSVIRLGLRRDEMLFGSVDVAGVSPDPTHKHGAPGVADYCAHVWGRFLILLGDDRAVVIDTEAVAIVREAPVRFVGKSSLDVCEFVESPSHDVVVALSTFIAIGFGIDGSVQWSAVLPGPIASIASPDPAGFTLSCYDVDDPALPTRAYRISFTRGPV